MLYKRLTAIAICFMIILITAVSARAQQAIVINLDFEYIRQGRAGLITLSGSGLNGAEAKVFERTYHFFPTRTGFVSFIVVPYNQKIKDYPIHITIYQADNSAAGWDGIIRVASGEFVTEPLFTMPPAKLYLLNSQIENAEQSKFMATFSMITPEHYWDGTFTLPVNGALTSPFGSVRPYSNDGLLRRHLGTDLRVPEGTPVIASSTGRVVLARPFDIHGNIVIIDHGWGIFSSYSHLSAINVVPGQFVLQGDTVGKSGNTGRSFGPHVHWEIAVSGLQVDPLDFIRLKLPQ